MKYRIQELDGWFTPQYKRFFFWLNFDDYYLGDRTIETYPTLSEAKSFIAGVIQSKKLKNIIKPIYHPFP